MTNPKTPANPHFIPRNLHPDRLQEMVFAAAAVNAAAIVTGSSWDDVFLSLVKQSHRYCRLPADPICVTAMLRDNGFVRYPYHPRDIDAETVRAYMEEHCRNGARAIVRTPQFGFSGHALAIVPRTENGRTVYKILGFEDRSHHRVLDIWLYQPDNPDRSAVCPLPSATAAAEARKANRSIPKSHHSYQFHQENPNNLFIGDCLVRGIATALGIGWRDAVDLLATQKHTVINDHDVFRKILKMKGFVRYDTYRPGEKRPTAGYFCMELNRRFQNGEPVFASLGATHVAAFQPVRGEDGLYRYHLLDTWDSSQKTVTEFWVRPAAQNTAGEEDATPAFAPGDRIRHPAYGVGTVQKLSGPAGQMTMEILFPEAGVKKLSCQWAEAHCTVCGKGTA